MSKLALALVVVAFAVVSLPRTSGATNYHVYKKIDLSGSTERAPNICRADFKEHRASYYCDKWREFVHHD